MNPKSIRFGRAIVLSILLFATLLSAAFLHLGATTPWRNIHIGAGTLMISSSTVHLVTNRKWLKAVFSKPWKKLPNHLRLNRSIALGMAIAGLICALTGLHWLFDPRVPVDHLHDHSGQVFTVLLGIHMLLHWGWMVGTARQLRRPAHAYRTG